MLPNIGTHRLSEVWNYSTVLFMSPQFYYVLHLAGILLVFLAYGLLIGRALLRSDNSGVRRLGAIASGIGLLLILVSGFALLAKLDFGWPAWALIKMAVWLGLGGMVAAINRRPQLGQLWFWVLIILGLIAVLSVYLKPTF